MRKIPIEKAIGLCLGHDITEIIPSRNIKHRAFKRGHVIAEDDLEKLRDLGKSNVYILEEGNKEVHEDDAAKIVAPLAAGSHINFDLEPVEGKINFYAACDGLFKVDSARLYKINALEIPSFPTLHNNFPVKKGKLVAAFRIIPLTCKRRIIKKVKKILHNPLFFISEYSLKKAGIIVTGSEVYEGRVKDAFAPVLQKKIRDFGAQLVDSIILPDDREKISRAVRELSERCDIIFVSGGTSVDPDDVTTRALIDAGVSYDVKGNPIQPGNNLTIGNFENTVICAVPAAALFYSATSLDIFLPRLFAGEKISKEDIYRSGHGGLCHFCKTCTFPICPFFVSK